MYIKNLVKSILGAKFYSSARTCKKNLICLKYRLRGCYNLIDINESIYEISDVLDIPNNHVFFGYYDIQQINSSKSLMLVHILPQNAISGKTPAKIAVYDIAQKKLEIITTSMAWSWQQGSRLRWSPFNLDEIIFNNYTNGKYCCQIWNIRTKQLVKEIPIPLYDFDSEMRYGISVNFSRLQRLRPGYGYSNIKDTTNEENIPANDGIYRYDFKREEIKLIVSYSQLASLACGTEKYQHYINHICFSPKGDKFMFFHIWQLGDVNRWKLQMCVVNVDGTNIRVLEEKDTISHYTWRDNNHLLTTKINEGGLDSCYALYNVETGEKEVVGDRVLKCDGHPTFTKDKSVFITDTYPQENQMQYLYQYDIHNKQRTRILEVFHDPRLYGEKRCDLHPRLTHDNDYITIDVVKSGGRKQVLVLKKH